MNWIFPGNRSGYDLWLPIVIILVASAIARAGTADASVPTLGSDGAVRFKATGKFRPTKTAAHESALSAAQEKIRTWLSSQNPPINRVPSLETVSKDMVRNPSEREVDASLDDDGKTEPGLKLGTMYIGTLEIELTSAQIRELRARERCLSGLWLLGEIMTVFGVILVFFRFEEWTKGYLTRALFIGSAVFLCAVLALMWWAK
jgi:hypothetical protein